MMRTNSFFVLFSAGWLLFVSWPSKGAESTGRADKFGLGKPLPSDWEPAVNDQATNFYTLIEKLEFRTGDGPDAVVYDTEGWLGGDYQRFWWKAEGEQETKDAKGNVDIQALYSRTFSPFWDFQTGVRVDRQYRAAKRETTGYFVVGLEGLSPYWFEVEPALFLSDRGRASFRLTSTYDQLITQRWVIQPRIDLDAAFQDDAKRSVAAGFNTVEIGLRLRYDIRRNFSRYAGLAWRRILGEAAGWARRAGEDVSTTSLVFGLHAWF